MTPVTYCHHRGEKTKRKKPRQYLTKEEKVYRFLIAMGAGDWFKCNRSIARQKAESYLEKDNKELILSLLTESRKPLSSGFLSCILNIPIDRVAHYLMILKSEFKVAKSVGGYWRALSFEERERLKLISEILSIFDMDFRLAQKTMGNDCIYSLSIFDLKNLGLKLQNLV